MSEPTLYTDQPPSPQALVDLFKGEWSTRFPAAVGVETGGTAGLCEDERVTWALTQLAAHGHAIADATTLEVGPLEAGHTYMLEQAGAATVTSVESNARSFQKCLLVKELMQLNRTRFLYGDILGHLETTNDTYDIGIACGILYHMTNPVRLIELLTQRCRSVYIWTVFYDPDFYRQNPDKAEKFSATATTNHAGYTHTLHRHEYGEALEWKGFCGGPRPHCQWMERDQILGALAHFGFTKQTVRDEPNPHGSALSVVASR
ncbi:hypothetical protein [Synoicihabitans lomoniglobus]|uniref:Class I SAM-dependent methyltransferase n=1 Tax=Synoicihabitans lomoniglobus TaxID=2909285 RepID=A0AAF0CQA6_9BACT|nr:hypothetical protein [Opitutaceae bacterium LMO-M01]WED66095.1 hypothetical protein PXH66_04445 [Opitutaceae bacterium LMO-M01]